MPSADGHDPHRFVLDESSFDFRGLSDAEVESYLDQLNETFATMAKAGNARAAISTMLYEAECLDGCELQSYLFGPDRPADVDPDTLRLLGQHLSKCPEWDDGGADLIDEVRFDDGPPTLVLSVAYALESGLRGKGVACLVFPGSDRRGHIMVRGGKGSADIFFFADAGSVPIFWRGIFRSEDVSSRAFFSVAEHAFPDLVFHEALAFQKFEGAYADVRDLVVAALAALNDHFLAVYHASAGLPREVQARLGAYGAEVSPESPGTRASERLMRQRDVVHGDKVIRCEWHAKLERHRNRIHFAPLPAPAAGKLLIGIFVSHLDT